MDVRQKQRPVLVKWILVVADGFEKSLNAILALLLSVLAAALCYQVYGRYILNAAPGWTEEVARILMVYITMLGSAVVMRRNGHIEVTAVINAIPDPIRFIVLWLRDAVIFGCTGILMWHGYALAIIGGQRLTPALEIPMYWPYLSIPLSGALMAFFLGVRCLEVRMNNNAEPDSPEAI